MEELLCPKRLTLQLTHCLVSLKFESVVLPVMQRELHGAVPPYTHTHKCACMCVQRGTTYTEARKTYTCSCMFSILQTLREVGSDITCAGVGYVTRESFLFAKSKDLISTSSHIVQREIENRVNSDKTPGTS